MKKPKQSIQVLSTLALAASDAREDTMKSVILNTLYEKTEINRSDLIQEIKSIYHFEPHKPEVDLLFNQLEKDGIVVADKGKVSLSKSEFAALQTLEIEIKDAEAKRFNNFKNFVTDILEKNLEVGKIKLLYSAFIEYLYNSFYEFGVEAIKNFVPKNGSVDLDNEDFIQEAFSKLKEKDLCDTFKLIVDRFPDNISKEDLTFLNDISLKTQSFVSLGVKPEDTEGIKEINPIDWVLYLDTNVLYSLLDLHSHPENQACKALIKLINDNSDILKVKLRYSDLTIKELLNKKNDFQILDDKLSNSAISAMLKSDRLDEFSRQFYTNLLNNREGTLHPSKVIDLSNITLKEDGIEVSRSGQRYEKLGDNFLNARTQDYLRWIQNKNDIKEAYCKEKKIPFHNYYRSDKQAYHDISLRELIIDYRYNNIKGASHITFNAAKYYAITLDDLLVQFDQYVRRDETDVKKFPVFFKPSFLLSKLVKVLPIKTDDYKKAYFKAVTSRGFNKDIRKSEDIQRIVTYLKQRGIDNDQVIYDLISQDLFLEEFRENEKEQAVSNEQFIEDEINRQFKQKQEELDKSREELQNAKSVAIEKSNESQELSGKVSELTQQVELFSKATKSLNRKISKLEKTEPKVAPAQTGINFEAAEKDVEIAKLKDDLKREREKQLREKQEIYRDRELRRWQFRSFIPLFISLIFVFIIFYINDWKIDFISTYINSTTPDHKKFIFSLISALIAVLLNIFVVAHIWHRFFNESNKKAYCDRLKMPENLKDI